jgi:ABC-2 type transport system permease protein
MYAIFKRELKSYLLSPLPYVLIGLFFLITSFQFTQYFSSTATTLDNNAVNSTLGFANVVLVFLIPVLTMKLFAEERKNKVDTLLIASPVKITSIVLAKYLAALVVFLILTATTLIYPIMVIIFAKISAVEMVGGYLGFILVGASFISFGVFASSLTESQVVAGVISITGLLMMLIMEVVSSFVGDTAYKFIRWFSLLEKYDAYQTGQFIVTPIIYYLSFIALFLLLTIRVVEKRRWS